MSSKLSTAIRALGYSRSDKGAVDTLTELAKADERPSHDRTLAIVGAVFLEDSLRTAISKHLMPSRLLQTRAQIFEDEQAPLQGLASRARIAYALGIIDDTQRNDIEVIRIIRNAFAHSSQGFTFKHAEIKKALDAFQMTKDANLTAVQQAAPHLFERGRFTAAICAQCGVLDQYDAKWNGSRRIFSALAAALLNKSAKPPTRN